MAYYITKPSAIDKTITVYWTGGNQWSDKIGDKKSLSTKAKAEAIVANPDGKNGGFDNTTIVKA